ncbi:MAG: DUF4173 domain-containing protein [Winogradskyella sp.]|uniref:DUF4153 domain-containing protein n=1 Tax=Winogradskyella sp. TaxID=1883156 RepID=UPI000F3C530D|nr:DUF4173 domain-containing protein [Winogradskyella sp.]RNC84998.1 MAG: DUF4173 domain-containing protein [Winogradskyella sp.]
MKQLFIITSAILFSILFFNKSLGLNIFLFSILTIIFLWFSHPQKAKERNNILLQMIYVLAALFVFFQNSTLSIFTNCVLFFTLIGSIQDSNSSVYIKWLNGIYSTIAGLFHRNFEVNNTEEKVKIKTDVDVIHLAKLIGIPLVFVIIFILLYKNGNPVFKDLINAINFSFINIRWILFTVLGYYVFNNISKPVSVEPATHIDIEKDNNLEKQLPFNIDALSKEVQLGITLLGILNAILVFYIATDIISIYQLDYSRASRLSAEVHNGINTLIASILIAISIILYFFRGNLNFFEKNKSLKVLTYAWISLNIVLIALIAFKNQSYISAFGLTYKRIGVHIYIFLTLIGLCTTLIKVLNIRNLTYLFRVNTSIAFLTLITLSSINWDDTITIYNLTKVENFDINYLLRLSDNNANALYELKDQLNISEIDKARIESKYRHYLQRIETSDWQEMTYNHFKIDKR